ncbi:MAG: monoamine oxidase, partial [Alphaproteobacteria bacterium]|nr:monoamine oxidase [Alphaproteobacteria bacterium]
MSKFSRRQVIGGAGSAALITGAGIGPAVAVPNTTTRLRADVCVVGAGFAGLAAAYRLKQAGAKVVLLEARNRVGGRSWTVSMRDGGWVDWGGQWVGPTQDRFYALIKEMGCETYPSPDFGKTLQRGVLDTDQFHRIEHEGDDSFPGAERVNAAFKALDALAATVDPEQPWAHKDAAALDGLTFAEWLRRNVEHEGARKFVAVEVGSVPSASPEEISMLHLLWLINACNGLDKLFGDEGGAQQDRLIGGTQLVARRVADKLRNEIKLGQPVRRIQWTADGVVVQSDSIAVVASRAVIALPPHLAGGIEYEPSLPTNRVQVTQRWPQGLVIKVSMVYASPFWRDDGLNG